jgi:5-methylcytosine-specific restriction endonuclease McrA
MIQIARTMLERIMTHGIPSFASLTDEQLLTEVRELAASERVATVALIAAFVELDLRRLYLGLGYPSLFKFCTQALLLSGDAAYNRIRAARVAAKWPEVLDFLADGSLTLSSVRVLSDVLTDANHQQLFQAARHMSRREVAVLVAPLKAPTKEALPPSVIEPVAEGLFYLKVAIGQQTYDELERLQDLLRHKIPTGDPAAIVAEAISHRLKDAQRRKWARTDAPRTTHGESWTRYVPSFVRREVWLRDGAQCRFTGPDGRCQERGFLEFHHRIPFPDGPATVENIELRCRAHNNYEAEQRVEPRTAPRQTALHD